MKLFKNGCWAYKDMIFVSIEAFLEPHSSAMGREKNEKWNNNTFLEASELFLNNF